MKSVSSIASSKSKVSKVSKEPVARPTGKIAKVAGKPTNNATYIAKIEEQESMISELQQTILLMETKMKKYEEMLSIKDSQIDQMRKLMDQAGLI